MAAFVKAANAKIRSNPVLDYVCSTPSAAADDQRDGSSQRKGNVVVWYQDGIPLISGKMTFALVIYSATFMRYALAVTPKNYLLFLCHFVNEGAQLTQGYRFLNYHGWAGQAPATKSVTGVLEAAQANAKAAEAKVEGAVKK
ncbi:putative protein family UPF0041 [Niveomyces insectorum RCEF 264]|uniref:Mitochondrial pyruvate carrier n=1 Tax=Niveomyces insectorum RCEF 264 TaxID=1081102 RepID=A0A162JCM0_9HYPO|nr:putative protein family UPF0041 [Niveomyces insectorum RCEF 264]